MKTTHYCSSKSPFWFFIAINMIVESTLCIFSFYFFCCFRPILSTGYGVYWWTTSINASTALQKRLNAVNNLVDKPVLLLIVIMAGYLAFVPPICGPFLAFKLCNLVVSVLLFVFVNIYISLSCCISPEKWYTPKTRREHRWQNVDQMRWLQMYLPCRNCCICAARWKNFATYLRRFRKQKRIENKRE
jgi:hypothetical protein